MRWLEQDFRGSLEEVWQRVIRDEPIALARFGEGEAKLMQGLQVGGFAKSTDGWSWNGGPSALADSLVSVLANENLTHGISCSCCDPQGKEYFETACKGEATFANIFVNANWPRFCELIRNYTKPVFLIASHRANNLRRLPVSVSGFYGVPGDCVGYFDQFQEELKIEMGIITKHWPGVLVLVAAGPLGTVLVDYLHRSNPAVQALDIGSALDPWLFGQLTRPYQNPSSAFSRKVCVR